MIWAKKTHQFLVGFAAETNDVIAHGRNKVERKNLDMLIANDVAMPGAGFNVTTNIAAILYKDGTLQQYPKMSKEELGKIIIEKIAENVIDYLIREDILFLSYVNRRRYLCCKLY